VTVFSVYRKLPSQETQSTVGVKHISKNYQ